MKLALFSLNITKESVNEIIKMSAKDVAEVKVSFVTTPANVYDKENADWLWDTHSQLSSYFSYLEEFDIEAHKKEDENFFYDYFEGKDLVFVSGGNVFYFNYWVKETGAENALKKLIVEDQIIYAGSSAGAIYPMKDIAVYKVADDPKKAPEVINDGMGIIDYAVIPHWGNEKYKKELIKIKNFYENTKIKTYTITDNEALIVNDAEVIKI